MRKKIVCIDFDGVIADYSKGYQGPGTFGEPLTVTDDALRWLKSVLPLEVWQSCKGLPGVAIALTWLKTEGWHIVICTARKDVDLPLIELYLANHQVPYDSLTGRKPDAHAYVDDRAVRFDGDWGATLREIAEFEPYYHRAAADNFAGRESGSGEHTSIILVSRIHKEATDEKMSKLRDEIKVLQDIPIEWRKHFPQIVLAHAEKDKVWYEMPCYNIPTIRRLVFSGVFKHRQILSWLDRILEFAFEMYTRETIEVADADYVAYMHLDRVWRRLNELARKTRTFALLTQRKMLDINGVERENIPTALEALSRPAVVKAVAPAFVSRWGHSDLHFSNILIDRANDNFILIDPRGYPFCDYYYDFGKLWHSVNGKYEFIAENKFSLRGTALAIEENDAFHECEKTKARLPYLLCKYSAEPRATVLMKTEFNEAMHFAALVPFLLTYDGREERALAAYYTAVILLSKFKERWL